MSAGTVVTDSTQRIHYFENQQSAHAPEVFQSLLFQNHFEHFSRSIVQTRHLLYSFVLFLQLTAACTHVDISYEDSRGFSSLRIIHDLIFYWYFEQQNSLVEVTFELQNPLLFTEYIYMWLNDTWDKRNFFSNCITWINEKLSY